MYLFAKLGFTVLVIAQLLGYHTAWGVPNQSSNNTYTALLQQVNGRLHTLSAVENADASKNILGVFVTYSHHGKTRACRGRLEPVPKHRLEAAVEEALQGALKKDYRYPPVSMAELKTLTTQVTFITKIEPIENPHQLNPFKEGILVRSGSRSGVILPGEFGDAHTQYVQAMVKAGIPTHQRVQMYRLRAQQVRIAPIVH